MSVGCLAVFHYNLRFRILCHSISFPLFFRMGGKGSDGAGAVAVFAGKVEQWCRKMPQMVIFALSCG